MYKIREKRTYSSIFKCFRKYCLLGAILVLLMVCGCKKTVHTINFKDYDGTILKTILVEDGQVPSYGTNPVREADEDFEYVFSSWDRVIKKATEDTEYQAQYDAIAIEKVETHDDDPTIMHDVNGNEVHLNPELMDKYFTVTFADDDGTVIQKMKVKYGNIPVYSGDTPVKIDSKYIYSFNGWDKEIDIVQGNTKYTATYTKTERTNVEATDISSFDISNYVTFYEVDNKNTTHSEKPIVEETYYTISVYVRNNTEGSVTGGGKYLEGQSVSISALAKVGYEFDKWNDGNTQNPRFVPVSQNAEYYPIFKTVPTYNVEISFNNDSIATFSGNTKYNVGSTASISFKLLKENKYKFIGWDDDGDGFPDGNTDNPRSIIVNRNLSFTPIFEEIPPQPVTITVKVKEGDSDKGSVSGSGTFDEDTVTDIVATANDGYHFVQWNDNNTTNPRSIIVSSSNKEYVASFASNIYRINAKSNNDLFGTVTGSGDYSYGSKVTLNAKAKTGYRFYKWSDDNYDNPREEEVSGQSDYEAIFIESKKAIKGDYISFDQHEDTEYLVLNVNGNKATVLSLNGTSKTKYDEDDNKYFGSDLSNAVNNSFDLLDDDVKAYALSSSFSNSTFTSNEAVKDANHESISVYPATAKIETNTTKARALSLDDIELFFGGSNKSAGAYNSSDLIKLLNISKGDSVWLSSLNDEKNKAYYFDYTDDGCSIKNSNLNAAERLVRFVFDIDLTKAKYLINEEKYVSTATPRKIIVNATSQVFGWGSVEGNGLHNIGTRVTIKAVPASGYKFLKWDKDEYTSQSFDLVPTSNVDFKAIFYKKVNPQKGDVLYFDDQPNKTYVVLDYDENGVATLLSRDDYLDDTTYSEEKFNNSQIQASLSNFVNALPSTISNQIKNTNIVINKFESNNGVVKATGHASSVIVPFIGNYETVSGLVYLPSVDDIEKFFATEDTVDMASVYSGNNLKELFNINSNKPILLGSRSSSNQNFAVVYKNNSYIITEQASDTSNCVVRPVFRIPLSTTSSYEYTINEKLELSFSEAQLCYVTASSYPVNYGTVSNGNKNYTLGTRVTLEATPNDNHKFFKWKGESSFDNLITIVPSGDTDATALFAEDCDSYTITVSSNDDNMGTVEGGGTWDTPQEEVTLKANAKPGYRFIEWSDSGADKYKQERTVYVYDETASYSAVFAKLPSKYDFITIKYVNDENVATDLSKYNKFVVLDITSNGIATVLDTSSSLKSQYNGEAITTYENSLLDKACNETYYNDLPTQVQNAIKESQITTYSYGERDQASINLVFYASQADVSNKQQFGNVISRKVYAPDVEDIENTFKTDHGTVNYSFGDLVSLFNLNDPTNNAVWLRSGDNASEGSGASATSKLNTYFWSINNSVDSSNYIAPSKYDANYCVRPIFKIDLTNNNVLYNIDSRLNPSAGTIKKGSIIKLNDNKEYRILSLDGTKAKLIAMYDAFTSKYSEASPATQATFTKEGTTDTYQGVKYEGSTLDNYLNNNWYSNLPTSMREAIIKTNVIQKKFLYQTTPNSDTDFNNGAITYKIQVKGGSYDNYTYYGSTNAVQRYAYTLGLDDIYNYFNKNIIYSNEINAFFFNKSPFVYGEEDENIWLNSSAHETSQSYSDYSNNPIYYDASVTLFDTSKSYTKSGSIRPAFTIDLGAGDILFSKVYPEISFDTGGGSFVQPIAAAAGSDISSVKVDNPSKAGFKFDGWETEIPDNMPEEDMVIKAKWLIDNVYKGSIIKLNDDKEYRVLSIDRDVAKVMAMYDDVTSKYSNGTQTEFTNEKGDKYQGIKYEGSTLDNYLNDTWYSSLPIAMKDAIIQTNVVQKKYLYNDIDGPSTYKSQFGSSKTNFTTYTYYGSVNAIQRYVYELGLEDIFDYFDKITLTSNEKNSFFFNIFPFVLNQISKNIWLNSSVHRTHPSFTGNCKYPYIYEGERSFISDLYYADECIVRPTFTINLTGDGVTFSKVNPEIIFDTDGGNFIQPISQAKDTDISAMKPANPTRDGFTFIGWDKEIPNKMPATDMVIKAKWKYNPTKGDLLTISGEDDKYNDYVVLKVDGDKVKLALRDEMPTFTLNDIGINDAFDREAIMGYIDEKCDEVKNNLSSSLQSAMVETDYESVRYTSSNLWGVGGPTSPMQYSNKYVCTLSCKDIEEYLGTSLTPSDDLIKKYASTFFLSDSSSNIAGRDFISMFNRESISRDLWCDDIVRLCPVFTIDLSKMTSDITVTGNALK